METAKIQIQLGRNNWVLGERTRVMGILNVTRDSFSDGGKYLEPDAALDHARAMALQGADILDVGGESTRPGAGAVSVSEELKRVLPVIRLLKQELDLPVSIDTYKHEVALEAIAAGADCVNDISGLRMDPKMLAAMAGTEAALILGHIRGTPRTMQDAPEYGNTVAEVVAEIGETVQRARQAGIAAERILVDPGIGFGKRIEDNLALLAHLSRLGDLRRPIVVGTSRKSFIGRILERTVHDRLEGTLATEVVAVWNGAHILRTHDVAATVRAARITDAIRKVRERPENSVSRP